MRKSLFIAVCAFAAAALFSACDKEPTPDGAAALKNITIASNINGVIDETAKTVTFTVPTSVSTNSIIADFTVTEYDVVKVGGTEIISGVTSFSISNGTVINVSDEISKLSVDYTVVIIPNDGKVELVSVTFAKADNAALTEDVVVEEIASEMIVRVPAAAFQQKLVIRVVAGDNDVIKINDVEVADGTCEVDTKFPIDITISDPGAGSSLSYVVKVGKILENIWTSLGVFDAGAKSSYFDFAVDPVKGNPYLVYQKTTGGESSYEGAFVAKWNGSSFSQLGSDVSGAKTTDSRIAVYDGTPYVFYKDAGAAKTTLYSVSKYDGSSWSFVGDRGFCDATTGTSYYKTSFAIDPASKSIITATSANGANTTTGQVKRGLSIGIFSNGAWDANKPIQGRTNYGYSPRLAAANDGVFCLVANQTEKTFSLYKEVSGNWSTLADGFAPNPGMTEVGTIQLDAACDSKGVFYAAFNVVDAEGNWHCMVYKFVDGNFVKVGNDIPNVTFSDKYSQFSIAFDGNDVPVVAYNANNAENPNVSVVTIDKDTNDWGEAYSFAEPAENTYLRAVNSKDGNCYVAFPVKNADGTFGFACYVYSFEEDIIPE